MPYGKVKVDSIETSTQTVTVDNLLKTGDLSTSTSSTSTTTAATSSAVKSAYDLANAALPKSGGTMTGAITFAAGQTLSGYAPLNSPTFTGTVTIPAGASISGYLTTSSASTTYAPQASPTFTGVVSDGAGPLRAVPQNSQTSAYTLVASDAGRHISTTTGGITIPQGVFNTGDAVSIYNNSESSMTISTSGTTVLRFAGKADTGQRTLAQYGLATILCVAADVFVIAGAGIT